jgi:hypothetical protein
MAKRKTSRSSSRAAKSTSSAPPLYTIEIFLMGGPLGEGFEGQVISHKI